MPFYEMSSKLGLLYDRSETIQVNTASNRLGINLVKKRDAATEGAKKQKMRAQLLTTSFSKYKSYI